MVNPFIYDDNQDKWNLAPAYDLTYPLDALLNFTKVSRALSINGKRTDITREDIFGIADSFTIKNANGIIDEVVEKTKSFEALANENGIPSKVIEKIKSEFLFFSI